jgi:hypothetical protein
MSGASKSGILTRRRVATSLPIMRYNTVRPSGSLRNNRSLGRRARIRWLGQSGFVIHVRHVCSPQKRLPPDPAAKAGAGCQDSQGRGRLRWQTKSFLPCEFHGHLAGCRPNIVGIVRDCKNRIATTGGPHTPPTIRLLLFREGIPTERFKPMPHTFGSHANSNKKTERRIERAPATSAKRHHRTQHRPAFRFWSAVSVLLLWSRIRRFRFAV